MALQTAGSPANPSAQVVGNAFVEQYYHILHTSPELVYKFYQDSSVISRQDSDGVMTSVTTMQGINEKILSLNFKDHKAEIETADAQKSYKDGVTVLVTGCLMGKDNLKRKFAQSFFLAPQENGYFVLNDVFRYVGDDEPLENSLVDGINNTPAVSPVPGSEPSRVPDPSAPDPATLVVDQDDVAAKDVNLVNAEKDKVYEREVVVLSESQSNGNDVSVDVESASIPEDDIPKKSYASIVKVTRGSSGLTKVYVPTNTLKAASKKPDTKSVVVPAMPATETRASVPSSNETPESSNVQEEVDGHSIYVRNLPYDITTAQLESTFKKFGSIKEEGVQVRYNKQEGYCFGFVEFHSLSSMNRAIQASPMIIGGRQAVIEIKRTSKRAGSGRGRFPSGRAGFRSESFRGRGNYGGGRGIIRNEYGNRGEYSGRARSSGGRSEGSQGRGGGRRRGNNSNEAKNYTNSA